MTSSVRRDVINRYILIAIYHVSDNLEKLASFRAFSFAISKLNWRKLLYKFDFFYKDLDAYSKRIHKLQVEEYVI